MRTTIREVFNRIHEFLNEVINQASAWLIPLACTCTVLLSSCTDKYADVTDWTERQSAVIELFNNGDYEDANKLLYRWLSEPAARQADLQMLADSLVFFRATSPDGKLDVFSWYNGRDGLVTAFNNVILYEDNGKIYSTDKCLWQLMSRQHGTSQLALGEEDLGAGCLTTDIHQITNNIGRTIYLTENYLLDSTWAYGSIDAFSIYEGNLHQQHDFFITKDREVRDNLQYSYYMNTFNYNIESILGPQSVFGYDKDDDAILVPNEEYGECADRYESHIFNGDVYVYSSDKAGKYLYPELRNFESLEHLYWVAGRLVRVDLMTDGSYRYAVWNLDSTHPDTDTMQAEPDMVIHNGKIVDNKWYQFTHNDTVFRINAYPSAWHQLQITQKDKVILDEIRKF